jgi:hypothetical protein
MANPKFKTCKKDVWVKIADNQISGQIWRANSKPDLYLSTYRTHNDAAPVLASEGMPIFLDGISVEIKAAAGIDVYIMAVGHRGKIRVDL